MHKRVEKIFETSASDPATRLNQAIAHHRAGMLMEAETLYRHVTEKWPDNFDALHLLGVLHYQRGAYEDAVRQIGIALSVNAQSAVAYCNYGAALDALERDEEALAAYDRAIALAPDNAEAYYNRANLLRDRARYEEALAEYDRALDLRLDHAETCNNRGNVLKRLKRLEDAIIMFDRAIALKADYPEAFYNRGNAFNELHRWEEAIASFDRAIALKPEFLEAVFNRGIALLGLKRMADAIDDFDRAIALDPNFDFLLGLRVHAKMHLCDWSDFDADCARLLEAVRSGKPACYPFQFLACPARPMDQLMCARTYSKNRIPSAAPLWKGERYAHERIRVAYLSSDFCDHPIAYLTAGMFEHHDHTKFEAFAISLGPREDSALRQRLLRSFDSFIDARAMSDENVARLLREQEVDIAVDLNGATDGSRPNIFAGKPTPLQVNYLGYAGTLGRPYCDYIIADRFVIPKTEQAQYDERIVYLPDSFMPSDDKRRISECVSSRDQEGLPRRGLVFCCFNNGYKITPDIFGIWMRLLERVEGSVLWLSALNACARGNLQREVERRGMSTDRLIFASVIPSNEHHLARLRLADLFLDTYYYNAHTTASDALWAGLPVLTCSGATFASRVAGSLLHAVGLPERVTHSLNDYEALALRLARDRALLAGIRQKLARNRTSYPLFDTERFTRHLEAAYITMWERSQRGERPQSFAVAAM